MFELNNHIHVSKVQPMTRLKSRFPVSAFLFVALSVIFFILPPQASALDITSQKTDRHVLVPGTNAFFAPSPNLVLASEFSGFESKNRRIDVIVAFLDGPIRSIEEGFTEDSFASLGMNLMAKGEFTIDSRRAILYKVMHDDGNMRWGKWIMLAENGPGTLVVNAVFVSGDTEASLELEQMLKGVYMDPVAASAERPAYVSPGGNSSDPSPVAGSPANNNERDNFDRSEAISILARDVTSSPNAASADEREQPTQENNTENETDNAEPERRGSARIITEDGVIYADDSTTAGA